jgi:hypothetical protein
MRKVNRRYFLKALAATLPAITLGANKRPANAVQSGSAPEGGTPERINSFFGRWTVSSYRAELAASQPGNLDSDNGKFRLEFADRFYAELDRRYKASPPTNVGQTLQTLRAAFKSTFLALKNRAASVGITPELTLYGAGRADTFPDGAPWMDLSATPSIYADPKIQRLVGGSVPRVFEPLELRLSFKNGTNRYPVSTIVRLGDNANLSFDTRVADAGFARNPEADFDPAPLFSAPAMVTPVVKLDGDNRSVSERRPNPALLP